ncbi:MAG: LTA synthase family protein [Acetatifactor sp.]|nr:LTA synthase family protein [Acetatifactor sp.]
MNSFGLQQLKELLINRKKWFGLALVLFIIELMLLVWPVGWIREDIEIQPDTGDMRQEQLSEETGLCQEFIPQFDYLSGIQLFFMDDVETLGEGDIIVVISDKDDNVLFQKVYLYNELTYNRYMEINVNLKLRGGETYYLSVNSDHKSGEMPSIGLCGTASGGKENRSLMRGDDTLDGQLLLIYEYSQVLTGSGFLKAFLLCLITAAGVAIGVPKNRKFRLALGAAILLAWPWVMGLRLERLALHEYELLPIAVKWTFILMYFIELVILLCTLSMRATIVVTNLVMTAVYSVNFFVYAYRGVPLKVSDLTAIRTAARVMSGYSFQPASSLAVVWALMVLFIVYGLQTGDIGKRKPMKLRVHVASAVLGMAMAVGMGYFLLYTNYVFEAGFQNSGGSGLHHLYEFNGYLIGTCMDIQKSRVRAPEGYSHEMAEDLLEDYVFESDTQGMPDQWSGEELPHVILIMNESFADLRVLGDLELSQENLPFFNSLSENTIRGYVHASVLGGGTANSEFEVFTGCSMGLLSASYPYQQYVRRPIRSMVSSMNEAGYSSWSLHPELRTNWNRLSVYQYLGFDHSLWKEDFEDAQVLHRGVSDAETYYKVEELFENRDPGEKLFIFDLTIQNHGGYTDDKALQRTVSAIGVSSDEANAYLSLVEESDNAFEQLITYFEQQDEKVIICMFGDHQPKFGDANFYETVYSMTEGLTEEQKQWNLYKTPFVIWANYDIEEAQEVEISMNYLGVLLQKTAGVPLSPYFSFLEAQMKEYPVITVNGYVDQAGKHYSWNGDGSEFQDYRVLQYNYLFDAAHTVEWGY